MHLEAAIQQIVSRLTYANVRFKTAKDHLLDACQIVTKVSRTARAERRLLDRFKTVRKDEPQFLSGRTEAFGILFRDDDRQAQDLESADRDRCPRGDQRKIRDR